MKSLADGFAKRENPRIYFVSQLSARKRNWSGNKCHWNRSISFFAAIATSNVEDIRAVLDFYRQEDDILEAFKRNQERLREAEEARRNQQNQKHGGTSTWSGIFGRSFTFGRSSNASVSRICYWVFKTIFESILVKVWGRYAEKVGENLWQSFCILS